MSSFLTGAQSLQRAHPMRFQKTRTSLLHIWVQQMLTVKNLSISYNGIKAIENIDVDLAAGEIVTLIGSNGAGKSSLLYAIMGLVQKSNGKVMLQDEDISSRKTPEIVRLGLSLVPESRDIFPSMTVKANLRLGLFLNGNKSTHTQAFENIYALFPR